MRYLALFLLTFWSQTAFAEDARCKGPVARYEPKAGVVANTQTAKAVAQIYLTAIYGAAQIRSEQPLVASLKNGVWLVNGTLPAGYDGGTAIIELCRRNGKVLNVIHTK